MRFKILGPLVAASLLLAACSDFFNGKNNSGNGSTPPPPAKPDGSNPFPAGFDPNAGPFSDENMLANIGLNVLAPKAKDFRLQTEILERDIRDLCTEFENGSAAPEQEAIVRQRWAKAMLIYHQLDSAPIGPVADAGNFLSDNLYAWPRQNYCGMDLEVARLGSGGKMNPQLLFTLKGMGAIEYLLFDSSYGTQCNQKNPSNRAAVEWTQKPLQEKRVDRCRFASQIARDIVTHAYSLERAWDPAGANFSKTMVDGSRYASSREAVNALSDALFSYEALKDQRLGRPLGLHKDCLNPEGKCASSTEHIWSGLSMKAAIARMQGFKSTFLGSDTPVAGKYGFDDALAQAGRSDVTNHILQNIDKALAAAAAVDAKGPLYDQIQEMDPEACRNSTPENPLVPACALHKQLREVSSIMKTEFLVVLSLKAPPVHQGDND